MGSEMCIRDRAGKGHEDYQEIDHKHYPMDERVIVAEHLKETQK